MIMRSPRAPILRSRACWAIASRASSVKRRVDVLELEDLLVLLGPGVPRLGQDAHQGVLVQLVEGGHHRQAAHELGDQAELDQVRGLHLDEQLAGLRPPRALTSALKPMVLRPMRRSMMVVEARRRRRRR